MSKGWGTLVGDVLWQFQKESAEDAVRFLLGVLNEISIRPKVSATEVKTRIEAAPGVEFLN